MPTIKENYSLDCLHSHHRELNYFFEAGEQGIKDYMSLEQSYGIKSTYEDYIRHIFILAKIVAREAKKAVAAGHTKETIYKDWLQWELNDMNAGAMD